MIEPTRSRPPAVGAQGLVKRFARGDGGATVTALDDVSISVEPGELFGFIGPDGAGKTTLFRILVTLLLPDAGTAEMLGHDVVRDLWALRPRIGYMPGRFSLYPDLSVEENLTFFATVFGTTIREQYAQIAPIYSQLEPFKTRRAGALSGGMKQKLALCCAIVHRPEILFLDEPTTGVDALSRFEFWNLLAQFKQSGLTIIVSTPYMDEARRCDRIALMQRGRILATNTPVAVAASFDRPLVAVRVRERHEAIRALREYPHVNTVYPFGDVLHVTDARRDVDVGRITRDLTVYLRSRTIHEVAIEPIAPTVEDVFMARMGAPEGEEERGAATTSPEHVA